MRGKAVLPLLVMGVLLLALPLAAQEAPLEPAVTGATLVTLTGTFGELVNEHAFILNNVGFLDGADLLVVDALTEAPAFSESVGNIAGEQVFVTGAFSDLDYVYDSVAPAFDYELDEEAFAEYAGMPVFNAIAAFNFESPVSASEIVDNYDTYVDESNLVVEGTVGRSVGSNSFLLRDVGLLGEEQLLVVDVSQGELGFVQLADVPVVLAGEVRNFALTDVELEYGVELDDDVYHAFEGQPVFMASLAANESLVGTVENVNEDPQAFLGHRVPIIGDASQAVGGTGLLLQDTDLIDLDGREHLLVVDGTDSDLGLTALVNSDLIVTGVVREFYLTNIEDEYGIDLEDNLYGEYEGAPVLVASGAFIR